MPNPYGKLHQQYIESYLKTGNAKIIGVGRELPAMKKNQQVFPIELALTEVSQENKRIFIGIIKDITERKNAEDKLYRLAYFNPLTNLPNAFYFEEQLVKQIDKARLVNGKLLLMKMDIDHFSKINLTHGRKAGDYAISLIADRLRAVIDFNFELFHYRGDIFYFLSRHSHVQKESYLTTDCTELASRLCNVLQDDIIIEGIKYRFTASIVSSIIDGAHATLEVVYELLNMAVKRLKNEGGNRHLILDNRAQHYLERRAKIKTQLPNAIERNEFYLALQPQFDTQKRYCSSEVLIRWHSKDLGVITPNEFIEIAEETGDIIEIGRWVITEVATLIARFNPPGRLAINISAKQLAKENFEHELYRLFESKNIQLNKLVIEVTETTLVQDLGVIRTKIELLADMGVEFSIDDFGTGYSSLSYLQNLNIHEIKIDKSFIDEIKDSTTSVPIVDSIIQLSMGLGARVVAEGVENINQFEYLKARQCQLIQGYLFAKPLAVTDWLSFVAHHQRINLD
ncbi:TPA: EAL domain-containing protein [Vibrio cholerae]|nr:EAL domain-containing protein [Vibrio cholerae]